MAVRTSTCSSSACSTRQPPEAHGRNCLRSSMHSIRGADVRQHWSPHRHYCAPQSYRLHLTLHHQKLGRAVTWGSLQYATHNEAAPLGGRSSRLPITRDRAWWLSQSPDWPSKIELIESCSRLWQAVDPSLHLEYDVRFDYLPVQPARWAKNIFAGWPREGSGRVLVMVMKVPERDRWITELSAAGIEVDRRKESEDANTHPNKLRFWLRPDDVHRNTSLLQDFFRESFMTYWVQYALISPIEG